MLASVLSSQQADVNIAVMRIFVQTRQYMIDQSIKNDEVRKLKRMLLLSVEDTDYRLNEQMDKINQIVEVVNNLTEKTLSKRKIGLDLTKKR